MEDSLQLDMPAMNMEAEPGSPLLEEMTGTPEETQSEGVTPDDGEDIATESIETPVVEPAAIPNPPVSPPTPPPATTTSRYPQRIRSQPN